jgi:hypothetical protein
MNSVATVAERGLLKLVLRSATQLECTSPLMTTGLLGRLFFR